ncbi:hypothetical protein LguiA_002340 [Lonicera macranthoides]
MEDYMEVALVFGGYKMLATTSFVGMGESVTKQAFDWVSNTPLIVKAFSVICRLTDNMVGHVKGKNLWTTTQVKEEVLQEKLLRRRSQVNKSEDEDKTAKLDDKQWEITILVNVTRVRDACNLGIKSDGATELQHEQLEEEMRKMIVGGSDEAAQQLKLIDAIQRLGVSYHFESETDMALKNHLNSEGKFKESLISDTQGLLSLYESAHLRVHEEDILDEALEFTTAHLEQMLNSLSGNTLSASQVVYALNMPIRKGLTRLDARHYIPIYQ